MQWKMFPVGSTEPAFYLSSRQPRLDNSFKIAWVDADRIEGSDFAIQAIAIGGVGPDMLMIPPVAPAGEYELCSSDECARIEVR